MKVRQSFKWNQGASSPSANTLAGPTSAAVISGKLFIADGYNNRVLGFNQIPTHNNQTADFVLGQSNMTTSTAQTLSATSMTPFSVSGDASHLVVWDQQGGNNRLLVYNSLPSTNNAAANVVLGSTSMTAWAAPAIAGQFGQTIATHCRGKIIRNRLTDA